MNYVIRGFYEAILRRSRLLCKEVEFSLIIVVYRESQVRVWALANVCAKHKAAESVEHERDSPLPTNG